MADGIRIRPQPSRGPLPDNQMIVLRDTARPMQGPPFPPCWLCGEHTVKTYHFQLVDGTVIVSTTIWARLLSMPDTGGFELVNVVAEPPTQTLSISS